MKKSTRITAILLIVLTLGTLFAAGLAVAAEDAAPAVRIVADTNEVTLFKRLTLSAQVSGVAGNPSFKWKSSDPLKAAVNRSGVVTGLAIGKSTITVTATVDGQTLTDSMDIYVVQQSNSVHDLLRDRQILGYQYSYKDDYYYTNDRDCWQKYFGFSKFYDLVAPYMLLEYDYVRVYFPYGGKDWMIQLWKGQYGMVFYGAETGIYTKRHTNREPGVFTLYNCAKEGDWLDMNMTMYHDTTGLGTYKREFTRETGKYWWCTGFKRGHLRVEEPARELRTEGTIHLKDAEMTRQFTDGLKQCGFAEVADESALRPDTFCVSGNAVHYVWQDISQAETTVPVKALAVANVLAPLFGPFAMIMMFFLDMGLILLS